MIGQAQRISELSRAALPHIRRNHTPVLGFTSGKGGTGKSFVSLNTAYALSELGKKVLLIDFDINFAAQHILVDVLPEYSLSDYLQREIGIEEAIYKFGPNLEFIFGESGVREADLTPAVINKLFFDIDSLNRQYDFIILDTAAGGGEQVLSVLKKSDFQIVVANPEPTAVMDAYVIVKLMLKYGITSDSKFVIVNKANNLEEGEIAYRNINSAVKNFLKVETPLLGIILDSAEIRKSSYSQRIFLKEMKGKSEAARVKEIARKLLKIKQLANSNQ